ncbi:MAG TPA: ECF-type sigma factor, partial [Candidatus Saccharimonadales bacterium]|nr:ECF-type sigma factor [Candidatus Saccharimonadales bacterium]
PRVYDELRRIAGRYMRSERPGQTLQATALVNEAFVRLVGMDVEWKDRVHFVSVAAQAMRRILVDRARARGRAKRGGRPLKATLDEGLVVSGEPDPMVLDLDRALAKLEEQDPRKSRALELMYFGGLTQAGIAEVLGVSVPTVERDLRQARAWLYRELS